MNLPGRRVGGGMEADGKVELDLGLSTNGRFGVNPSAKRLKRSASVRNPGGRARRSAKPLQRASSLPTETEEMRRQRLGKEPARRGKGVFLPVGNGGGLHEVESGGVSVKFLESGENLTMVQSRGRPIVGSQRGRVIMGANHAALPRSSSNRANHAAIPRSSSKQANHAAMPRSSSKRANHAATPRSSSKRANHAAMLRSSSNRRVAAMRPVVAALIDDNRNKNREEKQKLLKKVLLDMPRVSTVGPTNSRVEGILYRFRSAEELKIVCTCHGLFLSAAEFVRHGGGGDVAYPLKHILVNPNPLFRI